MYPLYFYLDSLGIGAFLLDLENHWFTIRIF
jgi:hypothetical protein